MLMTSRDHLYLYKQTLHCNGGCAEDAIQFCLVKYGYQNINHSFVVPSIEVLELKNCLSIEVKMHIQRRSLKILKFNQGELAKKCT